MKQKLNKNAQIKLLKNETSNRDPKFKDKMKEVIDRFAGKAGDEESETIFVINKLDMQDGYVTVSSSNKDIAKLCERLGKHVMSIIDHKETVQLKISRLAFRGIQYAFKVSNPDSKRGNKSTKVKITEVEDV